MRNTNFTCAYCGRHSTLTDPNQFASWERININESTHGPIGFRLYAITCPNDECKKLTLNVKLTDSYQNAATRWEWGPLTEHQSWQLLPESNAKVFPDYVPKPISEDYYEACRICNLSSKASATLARRCLQGMIRDFWGISKGTLKDEIEALEDKVDSLTWEAIDSVRKVGNIGAHMEKDINVIIDVETNEAQLLIELIEQLMNDWYRTRNDKQERLRKIKEVAEAKASQK